MTTDTLTTPVDRFAAEYEALSANGASSAPAWVQELRQRGMARFADVGFPTLKEENWRFTSVADIAGTEFRPAPDPSGMEIVHAALDPFIFGSTDRFLATFVNGRFAPALSSLHGLPDGVTVTGLERALVEHEDVVRGHLGHYASIEASPFTALNTALLRDGAFVYVTGGVELPRPLQLLFVTTASDEPVRSDIRNLVVVESGARVSLTETYAGLAESEYWTNAVTEMAVAENAIVDTYRIQRESERAFHTAFTHSRQGRDSVFSHIPLVFGARLARHDIHSVLNGPAAECTLNGLLVLHGTQHADHHTTLEHAEPHCNSWEFFNGVYDERAHGVFNGRIIVRQKAQRTDSKQTNNSLLLSETARADSQPQLEIYADDVRCTHGATLGPIEPRAMFYLRSRGLDEQEARRLLTYGFASEILNSVAVDELRDRLDGLVTARLAEAAARSMS